MKKIVFVILVLLSLTLTSCYKQFGYPVGDRVDKTKETMDSLDCYTLEYIFYYMDEDSHTDIGPLIHNVSITYDQINKIRFFQFEDEPSNNFYIHENGDNLDIYRIDNSLWVMTSIPLTESNDQENELLDFIYTAMNDDGKASFEDFPKDTYIYTKVLYEDMIETMEIEWFDLNNAMSNPKLKSNEDVEITAHYIEETYDYFDTYSLSITSLATVDQTDTSDFLIVINLTDLDAPLLELPTNS